MSEFIIKELVDRLQDATAKAALYAVRIDELKMKVASLENERVLLMRKAKAFDDVVRQSDDTLKMIRDLTEASEMALDARGKSGRKIIPPDIIEELAASTKIARDWIVGQVPF